jgi:hypothetical protein
MGARMSSDNKLIIESYASDGSKTIIRLDEPFIAHNTLCEFGFWLDDEMFIAFAVGKKHNYENIQICTAKDISPATDLMKALC